MSIVCGLDLHRQQVTFDVFDSVSGEVGAAGCGSPTASASSVGCVGTWPGGRTASRW
jgi:hypothetical protein